MYKLTSDPNPLVFHVPFSQQQTINTQQSDTDGHFKHVKKYLVLQNLHPVSYLFCKVQSTHSKLFKVRPTLACLVPNSHLSIKVQLTANRIIQPLQPSTPCKFLVRICHLQEPISQENYHLFWKNIASSECTEEKAVVACEISFDDPPSNSIPASPSTSSIANSPLADFASSVQSELLILSPTKASCVSLDSNSSLGDIAQLRGEELYEDTIRASAMSIVVENESHREPVTNISHTGDSLAIPSPTILELLIKNQSKGNKNRLTHSELQLLSTLRAQTDKDVWKNWTVYAHEFKNRILTSKGNVMEDQEISGFAVGPMDNWKYRCPEIELSSPNNKSISTENTRNGTVILPGTSSKDWLKVCMLQLETTITSSSIAIESAEDIIRLLKETKLYDYEKLLELVGFLEQFTKIASTSKEIFKKKLFEQGNIARNPGRLTETPAIKQGFTQIICILLNECITSQSTSFCLESDLSPVNSFEFSLRCSNGTSQFFVGDYVIEVQDEDIFSHIYFRILSSKISKAIYYSSCSWIVTQMSKENDLNNFFCLIRFVVEKFFDIRQEVSISAIRAVPTGLQDGAFVLNDLLNMKEKGNLNHKQQTISKISTHHLKEFAECEKQLLMHTVFQYCRIFNDNHNFSAKYYQEKLFDKASHNESFCVSMYIESPAQDCEMNPAINLSLIRNPTLLCSMMNCSSNYIQMINSKLRNQKHLEMTPVFLPNVYKKKSIDFLPEKNSRTEIQNDLRRSCRKKF